MRRGIDGAGLEGGAVVDAGVGMRTADDEVLLASERSDWSEDDDDGQ